MRIVLVYVSLWKTMTSKSQNMIERRAAVGRKTTRADSVISSESLRPRGFTLRNPRVKSAEGIYASAGD
jgi:hypothetical protein